MDKLNITEGEWKIFINEKERSENGVFSFLLASEEAESFGFVHAEKESDIVAIVTAVNNTYKQGIDPEAVPDMVEALRRQFIAMKGKNLTKGAYERFLRIENALKKAEL